MSSNPSAGYSMERPLLSLKLSYLKGPIIKEKRPNFPILKRSSC